MLGIAGLGEVSELGPRDMGAGPGEPSLGSAECMRHLTQAIERV